MSSQYGGKKRSEREGKRDETNGNEPVGRLKGRTPNIYQITSKVVWLARSGRPTCARNLFDEMPQRDTVAWNSMISCYSQLGFHKQALALFQRMRTTNEVPDDFSFTATLNACAGLAELRRGMRVHALVVAYGYQSSLPVSNSLVDMYGKCLAPGSAHGVFEDMGYANEVTWCSLLFAYVNAGLVETARDIFYTMPKKVEIAWNTVIAGYARHGDLKICLDLFTEMRGELGWPDQWTYSALMNACAESSEYICGTMLHAFIIKDGWGSAVEVNNSVLSFYARVGCLDDAMKEFESAEILTQISYNAVIDAYMKMGSTCKACSVFHLMTEKNVVSWTSMIAGYVRNGDAEEALGFFVEMIGNCIYPDDFTFGAVLHACSSLASLVHGRMVHGCIVCSGFHGYSYVGNGLVSMYAASGDITSSSHAFTHIVNKDLVSWNSMLFGFAMHGMPSTALRHYEAMVASDIKPDKVTFIGLLMACSHSGLVEKGGEFFRSMASVYKIPYETDHLECIVDMLGRRGHLAEAKALVTQFFDVNCTGNAFPEALLGACSMHSNVQIGTLIGKSMRNLEPGNEMSYVLLSNLYSLSGEWKKAELVRKTMVEEGIKKMPGCSWIEVKSKLAVFTAGNNSCLQQGVNETLISVKLQIENLGLDLDIHE